MPNPHSNHCSRNKSGTWYKRVFVLVEARAEVDYGRPRSPHSEGFDIHSWIKTRRERDHGQSGQEENRNVVTRSRLCGEHPSVFKCMAKGFGAQM